jgi:hypothetical protein
MWVIDFFAGVLVIQNPSSLDSAQRWVTTVLAYLGGYGGLSVFLYFLLKKTLEKTVDSRFDERLEKVKHELQLEQEKMSIVYENQKDSFRKILVAAHSAIEAIEDNIAGEGDWRPISQKDVNAFSRVLSEESLFMDDPSDHALRLFYEIMSTAVPYEMEIPTNHQVWNAHNQMQFIAKRLAEHFRLRVGLSSSVQNPLSDVELLGACRLINQYQFPEYDLPTKGPLKIQESRTMPQLITLIRRNPELLKSELSRLRKATEKDPFFFEALAKADRYLQKVDTLKSP